MLLGCIRGIILENNSKIENSASVMITSRAAGRTSNSCTMLGCKINIIKINIKINIFILFHPVAALRGKPSNY